TSSASGPRGAQSHLTEKENLPHAAGAPARSAKPFDHKIKLTPRHRRASHLKEKPTLPQHHIKSL
ncbi:MAG: hypothetical protein ACLR9F_14310, partial [Faecalibacterium prausnitzii]